VRNIFIRWLILTLAIGVTARLIPGIAVNGGIVNLITVAAIFGLINAFIRPIITLLTCPLVILTLGLFTLIINTLMFMLTARISPALTVEGFWPAFWASLIISIITAILSTLMTGHDDRDKDVVIIRNRRKR